MKLYFPEITFSAAHYIPGHEKCGGLHGHTYFVRNLEIEVEALDNKGMSIDFWDVKGYFKQWDHKLILPDTTDKMDFEIALKDASIKADNIVYIRYTTAEWMAKEIRKGLGTIMDWNELYAAANIHFELWEGPNQAVKV